MKSESLLLFFRLKFVSTIGKHQLMGQIGGIETYFYKT